ncbi:MAG TPA: cytochrome c [Phycisphaerae bacterium]|nr:cytochrome c [Phycisphaerae bacterium]HOJ72570.1 cytochrome c [Phycisphaerae bacterium]HOM49769.1 cytochrome c [Phycisphaerae bacterium]HON66768.1 cytochrome c [Phycisphaerae bacterium]HOQ85525.1 cytochrome c [Phycisphaerae bacterium]
MILANIPVPHDIPLPLPVDRVILQAVIVLLFLAHIVFINLMLGGAMFAVVFECIGLKRRDFDTLAREITHTITVNKSLAVVLGVGPLLAINVLYTVYFYSANALTGYVWISIVPLVAVAFLILYAYKYSWERLANRKKLHLAMGGFGVAILLFVPLIFLSNINLMLFPDRWTQVRGFLSALWLPNVWPRFLHFVLACVAVSALFMLAYFTRAGYPVETKFQGLDRPNLRRLFYGIAFGATLLQLAAGPLVLFTLPAQGLSVFLYAVIGTGAAFAVAMLALMWWEILTPRQTAGRFFVPIVALLILTGSAMGFGRHVYREGALRDHRLAMEQRTQDLAYAAAAAKWRADHGVAVEDLPLGQRVFRDVCSSCHMLDRVLTGPSIREIAELYKDDPDGIVRWTKAPTRKRTGFPAMPAFDRPTEQLRAVAEYMLELAAPKKEGLSPES